MGTCFMLFSPPPLTKTHQLPHSSTHSFLLTKSHHITTSSTSRKLTGRIYSISNFGNFLDLKPENQPEALNFDLPWCHPSDRSRFDVIVNGAGPAGIRLAEQVSLQRVKVCCVDPDPLSMWPNNYSVCVDEFENVGLEDCLDKTWAMACIYINNHKTKYLDRSYGRVSRKKLKHTLLQRCISSGVRFHKAKVRQIEHHEFESTVECNDGVELKGSLVVDASGFSSTFIEYDKVRNHGCQIAHGILAEVDDHPVDLDKMVLMDWRESHLGNVMNPT